MFAYNDKFNINGIAGLSSKLLTLAIKAEQGLVDLSKISLILYAGEHLSEHQRKLIRKVTRPDIRIAGVYGSAETGVFAIQTPETIK